MPPSPDQPPARRTTYEDVRDSPDLRRLLLTARAWGVRPSQFLAWDDDDRELALALHDYEADQCPGCGGQLSITTAPEAEERFAPGPSYRCHRCTAMAQAAELRKDAPSPTALLHTARDRALEPHQHDDTGDTGDTGEHDDDEEEAPPPAGEPQ